MSKDNDNKLRCMECEQDKDKQKMFYNSNSKLYKKIGKIPMCKQCLKKKIDYTNMDTIYDILKELDIVFDIEYWEKAVESKMDTFGRYMSLVNSLHQLEGKRWGDSVFTPPRNNEEKSEIDQAAKPVNIPQYDIESLKEKYGYGYPDNEYILFEKKFQQLRPSFQLVTTMHEECLREYCVNKVKETLAKARGDFKEAKDWASMAKDTAEAGKLKPSQMSKADLSQGLDGFGQLSRMVEEKIEMQKVLPKFTRRPKDDVDVTLWLYINYIRDLKGLPEAEYKEIWNFFNDRYEDYMSQSLDYGSEDNE